MKKILIVCSVALLLAVNAWADTVTFKSGKKVEGNIKSITNDFVTVDLYGVTEMTYDLADIQEINGQAIGLNKPATVATETAEAILTSATEQENIPGLSVEENPKIKLSDKGTGAAIAVIMAFLGIIVIFSLILYIYSAICLQAIAKKTDTQYGWMAWIPIANIFLMCNIGGVSYKWLLPILLIFVPFINILGSLYSIFLTGYLWYMIAVARGKPGWIGILIFIPILGTFIVPGYLAFSKDGNKASNKEDKQGAAPLPNIGDGQPAKLLGTVPPIKPPIE